MNSKYRIFTYCPPGFHGGAFYKDIHAMTLPSKIEYCKRWNIDFLNSDYKYTDSKIGYERIEMFLDGMDKGYEYQMYIEADAIIMNHTIFLGDIIDNNYDIMFARNYKCKDRIEINNGVFIVKTSEWSKSFLTKIRDNSDFYNHNWVSQESILHELNTRSQEEIASHVKFVSFRLFNAYYHQWYPEYNFQVGDFICHAAGCNNDYRIKLFTELQTKIIRNKIDPVDPIIKTIPYV